MHGNQNVGTDLNVQKAGLMSVMRTQKIKL
jgi:hypothetical protein